MRNQFSDFVLSSTEYAVEVINLEGLTSVALKECGRRSYPEKIPDKLIDPKTARHLYRITHQVGRIADSMSQVQQTRCEAAN